MNPENKSEEEERINLQHNTFGDSISFPEEDYARVHHYIERNLKFIKVGKQHGALFKTNDGLVTVTLYKSTSPIHSTSLEMSEVSSETDMLLISVPQRTDAAIFW